MTPSCPKSRKPRFRIMYPLTKKTIPPLPSSDPRPHTGKKFPVIAFRQNLPKILHAAGIFIGAQSGLIQKSLLISLPYYSILHHPCSSPSLVGNPVCVCSKKF